MNVKKKGERGELKQERSQIGLAEEAQVCAPVEECELAARDRRVSRGWLGRWKQEIRRQDAGGGKPSGDENRELGNRYCERKPEMPGPIRKPMPKAMPMRRERFGAFFRLGDIGNIGLRQGKIPAVARRSPAKGTAARGHWRRPG